MRTQPLDSEESVPGLAFDTSSSQPLPLCMGLSEPEPDPVDLQFETPRPTWALDQQAQMARLEAQWLASASRDLQLQKIVERDQTIMESDELACFVRLAEGEATFQERMEQRYAAHCLWAQEAERRAHIGVLDDVALQARTEAAWLRRRLEQQHRVESQFAVLQQRRIASEEAARMRWLSTAVHHIAAAPFSRLDAGGP